MDVDVLRDTPEMIHNIPQPRFERFIAEHLSKDPRVELRSSVGFVSCSEDDKGVLSLVEERESKRRYHIRSKYVIGCDGARSQVRESLQIDCEGEDSCKGRSFERL